MKKLKKSVKHSFQTSSRSPQFLITKIVQNIAILKYNEVKKEMKIPRIGAHTPMVKKDF